MAKQPDGSSYIKRFQKKSDVSYKVKQSHSQLCAVCEFPLVSHQLYSDGQTALSSRGSILWSDQLDQSTLQF